MLIEPLIRNSLLGFILGDVLGLPVEFKTREELKANPVTGLLEFGTHNQPLGTWSDDTSMVLATIESLVGKERLDYEDLMNKFLKWYKEGYFTPYGKCFDIGSTTRQALEKYYLTKCNPLDCGGKEEFDNGNGSLMRMLPIAFYCLAKDLKDKEIYQTVSEVSSLTHRHSKSIFSCYLYVVFMIHIVKGRFKDKKIIYQEFKKYVELNQEGHCLEFNRILGDITKLEEREIKSTGYVIDTLESSIWCFLTTNNSKEAILKAVNLGEDTDTIGAITGSIAGTYYQDIESLKEWLSKIVKLEEIIK